MKSALLAAALFISTCSFCQIKKDTAERKVKAGFGISVAQTQPEFPGGPDSLTAFLNRNIQYTPAALFKGEHGKVWLSFTIDFEGNLQDVQVLKSVSEELDKEAIRIVALMPKWKPGTIGNNPASMQYVLPIEFSLPRQK